MKPPLLLLSCIVFLSSAVAGQSGRKAKPAPLPPAPAVEETKPANQQTESENEAQQVTAEKNEDYRCTDDGSLARIIDKDADTEQQVFSSKVVDTKATITARPRPSYTKEARRAGVEGFVILRVVLLANGRIGRVRVVRRLPFGLTENAIRMACKIEFKPALKDSRPVSQWLQIEYSFRLADSSIYRQ